MNVSIKLRTPAVLVTEELREMNISSKTKEGIYHTFLWFCKDIGLITDVSYEYNEEEEVFISFINKDGKDDTTCFDTHKKEEIAELWFEFAKENHLFEVIKEVA